MNLTGTVPLQPWINTVILCAKNTTDSAPGEMLALAPISGPAKIPISGLTWSAPLAMTSAVPGRLTAASAGSGSKMAIFTECYAVLTFK